MLRLRDWLEKLLRARRVVDPPGRAATIEAATDKVERLNAFYYEVAMMKLNSQFRKINAIDTRTTSYFTIGSAILPIVAAFLGSDPSPLFESTGARWTLSLGVVFYVLLAIFYVWSFQYTGWDSRPEVAQWKTVSTQFTVTDLQRWLGNACVEAYINNEPLIDRKASKSAWALWSLAGEVIFLVVSVLLPMLSLPQ
jgi:hypothetical protein